MDYVGYTRVSTAKQGRSGLGLEAQEAAIQVFLKSGDTLIEPLYVEQESGKRADRPELAKAIHRAKLTGATLLVAKLDRLSRNAKFLLTLADSGVPLAFCDLPQLEGAMGRFMLTQMAAIAELEAGLISQRTKAALRAAKARGAVLGGFRGFKVDGALGVAKRQADGVSFMEGVAPEVERARLAGAVSLRDVADYLNMKGIKARRGGPWSAAQVRRVCDYMDSEKVANGR